ncbi:HlyD family secretion protein [Desulforhopalus sp. IMCC35007]|uniref:HlyD family secretion protein n=1 Tax=Desulforhopalus sp. IMCC35007 TaxID=2569543 RepID=UPI0010AE553D|nr:efflux RND transporter periplasmic adaptor subunit [Desulforhopalus sp. IMCC35007]TKB09896.1 HlyD family efflux transporter periplasmic adaptor subunit [Desulforhopalus sp. IMCC35007]
MRVFRTIVIFVVFAVIVAWLSYTFWLAYQPKPLRMQGQIEAQQYNISSKIPGRINEVLVRKGDVVDKGQLIFTILSPEIDAKLAQAQAGQDAAEALAEEVYTGTRTEQIEAARDKWQQAKAAAELMEKTFQRIENLYNAGVVAEQKRDEAETKLKGARFAENGALQMYKMAQEGAREETKKAVTGKARMAAGAVAEVEVYAADTKIESWHSGEVTQILLQSGELAPQGFPVVTIIDMSDAWAVFHVREDRLMDFNKGSEFSAEIPALGDASYRFRVDHIAAMGDFATWRATDSDKGFDMRTFEVEARPVESIEGLRAGMSVIIKK